MQYTVNTEQVYPPAAVPNSRDPMGHLFPAAEAEEGVKEVEWESWWAEEEDGGEANKKTTNCDRVIWCEEVKSGHYWSKE